MNICWKAPQVAITMDPDALQAPDYRFLATHHPMQMIKKDRFKGDGVRIDQEAFLQAFLDPEDFVFVPVLGDSGTGKSHLIRWLKARIPETPQRRVIIIPKLQTNLRDVVRIILDSQTDARFNEYRRRLQNATQALTIPQARERLLNRIAECIGRSSHPDLEPGSSEDFFADALPALFYDPYYRKCLDRDGGVIHQLAVHIMGQQDTVERLEKRRQFCVEDFPVQLRDIHKKAGEAAKEIYESLAGDDQLLLEAVNWVNNNLDRALAEMLDFGGDSLIRLIREVREVLFEQGVELVVLIEDFAKTQGLDRAILEAFQAKMVQPGQKSLCAIRVALACTEGYLKGLVDTFLQRMSFSVWLDYGEVNEYGLMSENDLLGFSARYLNASRLSDDVLKKWLIRYEKDPSVPVPNACESCISQAKCRSGFGAVDQMSLFPFTLTALKRMQRKVNGGIFNARLFIKYALRPVLDFAETEIPQQKFPSAELHQSFGTDLGDLVSSKIDRQDPQNKARRRALMDLWGPGNQFVDLSPELHESFSIPPLGLDVWSEVPQDVQVTPPTRVAPKSQQSTLTPAPVSVQPKRNEHPAPDPGPVVEQPTSSRVDEALEKNLEEITQWNNGKSTLSLPLVNALRELVYPALEDRIDWDAELLLPKHFMGASSEAAPFKKAQIFFQADGKSARKIGDIQLNIPLSPEELHDASTALTGLLLFQKYENWHFQNGTEYQRIFAEQLDRWASHVLKEIRILGGEQYDPVPTAVELLALGARLEGLVVPDEDPLVALVDAVYRPFHQSTGEAKSCPFAQLRSKEWNTLFNDFQKEKRAMVSSLISRTGCTKGRSDSPQLIDVAQIRENLEAVSRTWTSSAPLPKNPPAELKSLERLGGSFNANWERALQEEKNRLFNWVALVKDAFGQDLVPADISKGLLASVRTAHNAGVFSGPSRSDLEQAIKDFEKLPLPELLAAIDSLGEDPTNGALLDVLCHPRLFPSLQAVQCLLDLFGHFLDDTDAHVAYQTKNLLGASDEKSKNLLDELLDDIEALHQLVSKGVNP